MTRTERRINAYCRHCGAESIFDYKTDHHDDGAKNSYKECRNCGEKIPVTKRQTKKKTERANKQAEFAALIEELLGKSNPNHGDHGRFASAPRNAPVAIEIPDHMRSMPHPEFIAAAKQYAKDHFAGTSVSIASDNATVEIPWQGIKHAFSRGVSPTKAAVALRLDEVIKASTQDRTETDTDSRNTIAAVHHYKTVVSIDGKDPVEVGIVLREHIDGERYYDHYEIRRPASNISGELAKGQDSLQPITGRLILEDFSITPTLNRVKPAPQHDAAPMLLKAHVAAYQRTTASGAVAYVREHEDSRVRNYGNKLYFASTHADLLSIGT